MNILIGEEQQYLEEILFETFPCGLEEQNSMDKTTNSKGRKYLEFCSNYGLVIANGRTVGDEEGCFTFINSNESSVNDICTVSIEVLKYIERFEVEEQIWSDHLPIKLKLSINRIQDLSEKINLVPKLKWIAGNKEAYKEKLNISLRNALAQKSQLDIYDLQNLIRESYKEPTTYKKTVFKSKWFDLVCKKTRDVSVEFLSNFRASQYFQDKQKYKETETSIKACISEKKELRFSNG